MPKVLVIGGNAAGMTAAGRARRLDPGLEVTVLERGPHVSSSVCGTPYFISGDVPRAENLIRYTPEAFQERRGARVLTGVAAEKLDLSRRRVVARNLETGREIAFPYDRLLVATGYAPRRIEAAGAELGNIFSLANLSDALAIRSALERRPQRALLVGAGLVNLEMAESLSRRGVAVTMLEKCDHIVPGLDPEMADLVEAELARHGVAVWKGRSVRTFFGNPDGRVQSAWVSGIAEPVAADIVLVDIGVRPETGLARAAGIALGRSGAIAVSERLETSAPSIYAAGNCAETLHLVSNQPVANALGTAANKQGRVAGENLARVPAVFRGVLNTWVVRVFDAAVARTGLTEQEARACGFLPVAAQITAGARARYLGEEPVTLRAIADRASRRLLGVQAVGGGADKRVDVAAVALTAGMKVDEAAQLDLGYAPPYSQVWDPFLVAMNALLRYL